MGPYRKDTAAKAQVDKQTALKTAEIAYTGNATITCAKVAEMATWGGNTVAKAEEVETAAVAATGLSPVVINATEPCGKYIEMETLCCPKSWAEAMKTR